MAVAQTSSQAACLCPSPGPVACAPPGGLPIPCAVVQTVRKQGLVSVWRGHCSPKSGEVAKRTEGVSRLALPGARTCALFEEGSPHLWTGGPVLGRSTGAPQANSARSFRTLTSFSVCLTCPPWVGGRDAPRREATSEVAPEAVRQAVGGGCQSGWGRLLLQMPMRLALVVRETGAGHRPGALEGAPPLLPMHPRGHDVRFRNDRRDLDPMPD